MRVACADTTTYALNRGSASPPRKLSFRAGAVLFPFSRESTARYGCSSGQRTLTDDCLSRWRVFTAPIGGRDYAIARLTAGPPNLFESRYVYVARSRRRSIDVNELLRRDDIMTASRGVRSDVRREYDSFLPTHFLPARRVKSGNNH